MGSLKLKDRVAIVTGSTSGIGEAIVKDFAEQGAKVVVLGRREAKGNKVVEDIKAKGGESIYIRCDAKNEDDIKNVVEETIKTYGRIDILVNNAGCDCYKPTHLITGEEWDNLMSINGKSVFLMSKYVLPYMMEQKKGSIINTSSIASVAGVANVAIYAFSKAGVAQMAKSMAVEYGPYNIRVNAIAPGLIATDMWNPSAADPETAKVMEQMEAAIPLKKVGDPVDIAKTATFLASDDAKHITGMKIVVDGGQYA